ncbi:MAG: hypothetical protein LAT55_08635 [Opitutales bacterium]|nr:hypothetical protein [Opitutales bacterium]
MAKQHQFEISFFEDILRKSPKYAEVVEILGGLYTEVGRIDDGLKMDRKLVRLMPENPTAHYNLACSLALKKRSTDAIKALSRAIDLGYTDVEWLQMDPDLDPLRKHPQFKSILNQLKDQN